MQVQRTARNPQRSGRVQRAAQVQGTGVHLSIARIAVGTRQGRRTQPGRQPIRAAQDRAGRAASHVKGPGAGQGASSATDIAAAHLHRTDRVTIGTDVQRATGDDDVGAVLDLVGRLQHRRAPRDYQVTGNRVGAHGLVQVQGTASYRGLERVGVGGAARQRYRPCASLADAKIIAAIADSCTYGQTRAS